MGNVVLHRLRHLIASEEEMYFTEMASKAETLLERQARMRERARSLREKRERERVAEAERRLEQRWRYYNLILGVLGEAKGYVCLQESV